MKKVKWIFGIIITILILFLAAQFMLPHSTESVVGYSMEAPRCGILVALNEASDSYSIELDKVQMTEVGEMLSSLPLRRTFEKGNVRNCGSSEKGGTDEASGHNLRTIRKDQTAN